MAIPDYQTIMLPLLEVARDGKEHYIHDAVDELAQYFQLTEEEATELLPSGQQPAFYNRVGWARTYLKKAGLLEEIDTMLIKLIDTGLFGIENKEIGW